MDPQAPPFRKTVEVVRDGFATPHGLTGLPGRLSGCLYRADGSKVAHSERFGGHLGDHAISDNPEQATPPGEVRRIAGRGLYLGHYMAGHYGHFITEGLSTAWVLEQEAAKGFDYFLFHPFTFGDVTPAYAHFCFQSLGIDRDKIIIVGDEAVRADELVVPERLLRLNYSADPRLRWVYRHIAEHARRIEPAKLRLYLSRRRFSHRKFERAVANEVYVEALFRERGFEVIYPETLPFEAQLALYDHAEIVAGMSGSGLHNSLFMRPGARLIELGDPRYGGAPAPTQRICNSVSGVAEDFVPFIGRRFGERWTLLWDLTKLARGLDELLGPAPSGLLSKSPRRQVSDAFEVAYLTLRPSIGAWARSLLGRRRAGS